MCVCVLLPQQHTEKRKGVFAPLNKINSFYNRIHHVCKSVQIHHSSLSQPETCNESTAHLGLLVWQALLVHFLIWPWILHHQYTFCPGYVIFLENSSITLKISKLVVRSGSFLQNKFFLHFIFICKVYKCQKLLIVVTFVVSSSCNAKASANLYFSTNCALTSDAISSICRAMVVSDNGVVSVYWNTHH